MEAKTEVQQCLYGYERLRMEMQTLEEELRMQKQFICDQNILVEKYKNDAQTNLKKLQDKKNILIGIGQNNQEVYLKDFFQMENQLAELKRQYDSERTYNRQKLDEYKNMLQITNETHQKEKIKMIQTLEESISKQQLINFLREIDQIFDLNFSESFFMQSGQLIIKYTLPKFASWLKSFETKLQQVESQNELYLQELTECKANLQKLKAPKQK